MIWDFAADFIRLGDSLEERQNYLNAACSAWNIACNSSESRTTDIDQYISSYRSFNPDASEEDLAGVRSDMETLIQNKLRLFPDVNKQIVGAQLSQEGEQQRIDVASTRLE